MLNFYILASIPARALLPVAPGVYATDLLLPLIAFSVVANKTRIPRLFILALLFFFASITITYLNLTLNQSWNDQATFSWYNGARLSGLTKVLGSTLRVAEIFILAVVVRNLKLNRSFLLKLQYSIALTLICILMLHVSGFESNQIVPNDDRIAQFREQSRLAMPTHANPNVSGLYVFSLGILSGLIAILYNEKRFVYLTASLVLFEVALSGGRSLLLATSIWYVYLMFQLKTGRYLLLVGGPLSILFGFYYFQDILERSLAIQRIFQGGSYEHILYRIYQQWAPSYEATPNLLIGAGFNYFYSMDSLYIKVILEFGLFSFLFFFFLIKLFRQSSKYCRVIIALLSIVGLTSENILYSFVSLFIFVVVIFLDRSSIFCFQKRLVEK